MPDEADEAAIRQLLDVELMTSLWEDLKRDGREGEVLAELRKVLHTLIDTALVPDPDMNTAEATLTQMVGTLNDWSLSYQLARSPGWRKQMAASQAALDEGRLGEPVPASRLREALVG